MDKILLCEDDRVAADILLTLLGRQGYQDVTWITGVNAIHPDHLEGIDRQGNQIQVTIKGFQLALVDGTLEGKLNGWEIIPALVSNGIVCLGMSNREDFNQLMRDAGARRALLKGDLMGGMLKKQLLLRDFLAQAVPLKK